MMEAGYEPHVVNDAMSHASADEYITEMEQHRNDKKLLYNNLLFLARSETGDSHHTRENAKVTMFIRLLSFDHTLMGKKAVTLLRVGVAYWTSAMSHTHRGPGCEPQRICL